MFMRLHIIESTARTYLPRATSALAYPLAIGAIALILTISMIPFASILVAAVLLRRDRWVETIVLSSSGAATGGLVLYFDFSSFGLEPDSCSLSGLDAGKGVVRRREPSR
jgi:hypothetical protein